jgi:hypothetical protein
MRNVNRRLAHFILALGVLALLGAALWQRPAARAAADAPRAALPPGTACKVYLRADAAGTSGQYVPNLTNNATLAGKVAAIDDQWLVLTTDKGEYHIPRPVILTVEVGK